MKNQKYEIPAILYEEPQPGHKPNPIPYIEVAQDKTMPPVLIIFEYKDTGETEIGDDGQAAKVVDQIPHKYVDLELLKERLPGHINDMIRVELGMQPLSEAKKAGQVILDKVNKNVENIKKSKKNEA